VVSLYDSVFSYTDYRAFLKDFYEARKKDDPHFSHGASPRTSGSTRVLQKNPSGKRNISNALIARLRSFSSSRPGKRSISKRWCCSIRLPAIGKEALFGAA